MGNSVDDQNITQYPFGKFWIMSEDNSVENVNYWLRCLEKAFEGKIKYKESKIQYGSELEKMVIRIHFLLLWKKMFHFTNSWTKRFEEILPYNQLDTIHTLENYSKDYISHSVFSFQVPILNGTIYKEIEIRSKWIKNWSETVGEYGLEETSDGFLIIIRKLLDLYYPRDSKDIKLTIVSEISENRVFKKSTLI